MNQGRTWRGLLLFFIFAVFLNAALMAPALSSERWLRPACGLAAAGAWVAAFFDAMRAAGNAGHENGQGGSS